MSKIYDAFHSLVQIALFVTIAYIFLQGIAPLWPLFTIAFVAVGTIISFSSRTTACLAIGGLILYCVSWPIYSAWGMVPSTIIWMAGVLLWFVAVLRTIAPPTMRISPNRC